MNVVSDVPDCITTNRAWVREKLAGAYRYLAVTANDSYVLAEAVRATTVKGICLTGAEWCHPASRTTSTVDQTDHDGVNDTGVCWLSKARTSVYDVQLRFTERAFGGPASGL